MNQKIVIYGCGKRGTELCRLAKNNASIKIIIYDSNPEKWNTEIEGHKILSPEFLKETNENKFCIALADQKSQLEVRELLIKVYGYQENYELDYQELWISLFKFRQSVSKVTIDKNQEKDNLIFSSINGLGLGGIEAWTEQFAVYISRFFSTHILTAQKGYCIPNQLEELKDECDYSQSDRDSINIADVAYRYIVNHLPCILIGDKENEILKAACAVKEEYGDAISIVIICHVGLKNAIKQYVKYKKYVTCYIGVSKEIYEYFIDEGIPEYKVFSMQIPFACPMNLVRSYNTDIAEPLHIGYAGRICYIQKRADLLIKLIDELEKRKVNYQINVAGEGIALKDIKQFTFDRKLQDKILFYGNINRDKISKFWEKQDICINLADYEGRSISITEAMGNGAIPIVTETSGVKEDIINDINGYIVEIGDYKKMADKIEYLSLNRQRLKELGKNAHDIIYPKSLFSSHAAFWNKLLTKIKG